MIKSIFKPLLIAISLLLISSATLSGQTIGNEDRLGLGAMLGEPTGVSLKYWHNQANAIDAGAAWSLDNTDELFLQTSYLWHSYNIFDVEKGSLPLYYGIGGRVILSDADTRLGARVPVGLNYHFEDTPLDLFVELAPILDIAPDTDFDLNGAIGVRFYF